MHCRMFCRFPGLYPVDSSSVSVLLPYPFPPTATKMPPDIAKCPMGEGGGWGSGGGRGAKLSLVGNDWSRGRD